MQAAPSAVPNKPKPATRTAEPVAPIVPMPERQAPPVEKMPQAETSGGMSDAKREIMMRESGGNANASAQVSSNRKSLKGWGRSRLGAAPMPRRP